jgi:hypothetical protein
MLTVRRVLSILHRAKITNKGVYEMTALVTGQLSKEIREAGKEIETLFGVLDEDTLKLR